ncbi:MAG: hypothetical protein ACRDTC_25380 [Pseudonocardiaceae bacterium]
MTQAEIGLAIANPGQPQYDVEPVPEATLDDLDGAAVLRALRTLIAEGVVEAQGDPKSPQRTYRWVGTS